jgi:hypothetical protein
MMVSSVRYSMVVAVSCLALGCGKSDPPAEIVTGRVTYKGKPVVGAGIRFYESRIGFGLVANLDADGRYVTPSPLPVGEYQVSITGAQPGGPEIPGAPPPSPIPPAYVDEGYRDGSTSGLDARVSSKSTTFDYDISEGPPKEVIPAGRVLVRMAPEKPSK